MALSEWHQSTAETINKIGASTQEFSDASIKVIQEASSSLADAVKNVSGDTRDVVDKMHSASGSMTMRANEASYLNAPLARVALFRY